MDKTERSIIFQGLADLIGVVMAMNFRGLLLDLSGNPPTDSKPADVEKVKDALVAVIELDEKLRNIYPVAFANAEHNKRLARAKAIAEQRKVDTKHGRHVH